MISKIHVVIIAEGVFGRIMTIKERTKKMLGTINNRQRNAKTCRDISENIRGILFLNATQINQKTCGRYLLNSQICVAGNSNASMSRKTV